MRMRTLIWLVVLAVLGTVAFAYGKTGLIYFRIKGEMAELANKTLVDGGSGSERMDVDNALANILERTGLELTRSDIVIRRDKAAETVTTEAHVALPTVFPFVNKTIYRGAVISVHAQRIKSY